MKRNRYRQLFLFLVALILPSLVIAGLGWMLLVKDREIEARRSEDAIDQEAMGIGRAVLFQLESIGRYAPEGTAAASGALVLVGWTDERGGLVLPWEHPSSVHRFSLSGSSSSPFAQRSSFTEIVFESTHGSFRQEPAGPSSHAITQAPRCQ